MTRFFSRFEKRGGEKKLDLWHNELKINKKHESYMLIEGKKVSLSLIAEMAKTVKKNSERAPQLAVILIGDHAPSQIYVNHKIRACNEVGILSLKIEFPEDVNLNTVLNKIEELNKDQTIDGILIQLPLPAHLNPHVITQAVQPKKDVDGLHPTNFGKLLLGQTDGFTPCTPLGIQTLIQHYQISTKGKNALVIGRSAIVGKPMAAILMQNTPTGNATVTLAHSHSKNLPELSKNADIIISAVGNPRFIKANMIKEGVILFDVGINRVPDSTKRKGYSIVGDVDFEEVHKKCKMITPVPNGVGPMTIAMLLQNTLKAYYQNTSL